MLVPVYSIVGALIATVASDEEFPCWVPIDLLFLQDSTGSFEEDLPNVMRQIPDMVKQVNEQNPHSFFAVADFKDKPFDPLGEKDDYCYQLDGSLSNDTEAMLEAYKKIYASGGKDYPEAQFQALINSALDPEIDWRPLNGDIYDGTHAGARVIVLSTDAVYHVPGDMEKVGLPSLPENPGDFAKKDLYCKTKDYPSVYQAKDALQSMDIYLAVLTPYNATDKKVENAWRWFSEDFLGQPSNFLQLIKEDSSDLLQGLLKAVKAVTETVCLKTTTPSESTTTEKPVTTTTEKPATTTTKKPETTTTKKPETTTTEKPVTTTTEKPVTTTTEKPVTTTIEKPVTTTTERPVTTTTMTTTTTKHPVTEEGETEECPPCPHEPCDPCHAVVIKAWERPHRLHVEYKK